MSIAEQIKALEATRAAKAAEMETVTTKSVEAGETMTAEEGEQFDTLSQEIEQIDVDLKRLRRMEQLTGQKAAPVAGHDQKSGSQSRAGQYTPIKNTQRLEPGVEFARYAKCILAGQGNLSQAADIAKSRYPDDEAVNKAIKANAEAGTTEGNVLAEQQTFTEDFIEFLRPQTIIGQMQGFKRVPFNVKVNGASSGTTGHWVGEGSPAPLSSMDFSAVSLETTKLATIAAITQELVRDSSPSADLIIRDDLASALIAKMDSSFIDPTHAGTPKASPASVSHGVDPIASAGKTPANVRKDIAALWQGFIAANVNPSAAVYVMSSTTALALSLMTESGVRSFPDIGMNGGTLNGVPVVTSEHVGGDESGRYVFLVNAADIFLADDGQVSVDVSREATLPMTNEATGETEDVNLWQHDMVGMRARRYINWARRRPSAVAYVTGAAYGQ